MDGKQQINILWLYPDVLRLHGCRGELMALAHVARLLGGEACIRRADDFDAPLPLADADLVVIGPGQLRDLPNVTERLARQEDELAALLDRGGLLLAQGSSGAVLAQETQRQDGSRFPGLSLLDMTCTERQRIYGDDLWFCLDGPDATTTSEPADAAATGEPADATATSAPVTDAAAATSAAEPRADATATSAPATDAADRELVGVQIQLLDTALGAAARPLGQVRYGYGNDGRGAEGCRAGNVLFSNGMGPLLARNPWFCAALIREATAQRGLAWPALSPADVALERQGAALTQAFMQAKPAVTPASRVL